MKKALTIADDYHESIGELREAMEDYTDSDFERAGIMSRQYAYMLRHKTRRPTPEVIQETAKKIEEGKVCKKK